MKKGLLILAVLTLCLCMMTSCGSLIENAADMIIVGVIDSVQEEYEEKGYDIDRADAEYLEGYTRQFKEWTDSEFQGEVTHYLYGYLVKDNYSYISYVYVIALSELSDGEVLENFYREYYAGMPQEGMTVDINNAGLIVTIEVTHQE